MLEKIKKYIDQYWLLFIVVTQPILDIIAFFTFNEKITIISFLIRSIYLIFIVGYSFYKTSNKKKYILCLLPIAIFSIFHLLNSYRTSGFNLFDDLRYLILVMQMPIITISLCFYVKENEWQIKKIGHAFAIAITIIATSVLLSVITGTGKTTYTTYGLNGWFTSPNTQSMILSVLCPFCLYYFSKQNDIKYLIASLAIFILLFNNGTRACYYSLVALLAVNLFNYIVSKNKKNIYKISITTCFLLLSLFLYHMSFASLRQTDITINNNGYKEEKIDYSNEVNKNKAIDFMRQSYLFDELINNFGEDRVYYEMKDKINAYNISDNRLVKRIYGKFIFEDSDFLTKIVGFNHYEIKQYSMDLENDLTALFYYYGYLGFALYIIFILYFMYLGIRQLIIKPSMIFDSKFVILGFTIVLALYGSEYSGALLRKPNANIYLSLILVMFYVYTYSQLNNKEVKKNKLSFLMLHIGYGGIETAIVNTANSLCDKYTIELISFYKLKKNQVSNLDKRVTVKYLYNGEPNRDIFKSYLKKINIPLIFKEGMKAISILVKKRYLIIRAIIDNDASFIISTRYEFSIPLSKYGSNRCIKIAEEHCYHNNNRKYINIIKKKYNNIDYLFALTKTLEEDYRKFLKNNSHTKIVLMPNMLYIMPDKKSDLNKNNIITLSRLDVKKKNDDIIRAFSKIKEKDWHLYILGDGNEFDNLNQLIKDLQLSDRVFLTGYKTKEEIPNYMLNASIFLMASLTEGLPMVLLEAMSYGIPCIAYNIPSGVNDIIDSNKNGYVVNNRNEEEYVKCIEKLINNKELRKNFSTNAINKAKEFSKEEITKKWDSVLSEGSICLELESKKRKEILSDI